jgi:Flp pilus assembly protein TadD
LDQRDLAAPLLDRAARGGQPGQSVASDDGSQDLRGSGAQLRGLLRSGQGAAALAMAERFRALEPGSGDAAGLLGDALTAAGRPGEARDHYRVAAKVRFNEDLLLRIMVAEAMAGRRSEQETVVAQFHAGNPASRLAVRLAATSAAQRDDWAGAIVPLESLVARGGQGDVRLLCDLSFAQLRSGDTSAARTTAERAYRLQPASLLATQALGMALAAAGERPRAARSLLDKARKIGGDNPLLAEARAKLKGS